MTEGEKKIIREKHPGHVAQDHKLASLMKKRKEGILHNKEQFALQSTEQSTVQPSVHPTVHSNCFYGVTVLAIVVIGVYVSFAYNAF